MENNASLRSRTVNHLATGGILPKITYGLRIIVCSQNTTSFIILRSWTIFHVPPFFFTGKIVVSHVALVGINSSQERNLYTGVVVLPGFLFYWTSFPPGELSGVSEGYNDGLCQVFPVQGPRGPKLRGQFNFLWVLSFPCWRDSESSLLSSEVVKPWGLKCLP